MRDEEIGFAKPSTDIAAIAAGFLHGHAYKWCLRHHHCLGIGKFKYLGPASAWYDMWVYCMWKGKVLYLFGNQWTNALLRTQ